MLKLFLVKLQSKAKRKQQTNANRPELVMSKSFWAQRNAGDKEMICICSVRSGQVIRELLS